MMSELDTYTNGDNEQPVTCPICGSRTTFNRHFVMHVTKKQDADQINSETQHHKCLGCPYEFLMED